MSYDNCFLVRFGWPPRGGSEHSATQGAFSPAYDFSHLTSLQRMRRPAGWHTLAPLSARISLHARPGTRPGRQTRYVSDPWLGMRSPSIVNIIKDCTTMLATRVDQKHVLLSTRLYSTIRGAASFATRKQHPEPSYRDPSHSGRPAYAPVDLPTPSV